MGIFLRSLGKPATNFTFDDTLTQIGLGYWILFLLSGLPTPKLIVAIGVILLGYWFAFVIYPSPGKYFPYSQYGVAATWTEHYEGIASHFNKNSNLAWAMDRWWMNLFPRNKVYQFSSGGYCLADLDADLGAVERRFVFRLVGSSQSGMRYRWVQTMGFVLLGDWSQLHCCVCDELDSQGADSIGDRTSLWIFGDSAGGIRGMDTEAIGAVRGSAIVSSHVVGGSNASAYVDCAPVDASQKDLRQDLALCPPRAK